MVGARVENGAAFPFPEQSSGRAARLATPDFQPTTFKHCILKQIRIIHWDLAEEKVSICTVVETSEY
jgi:hypothetical protein